MRRDGLWTVGNVIMRRQDEMFIDRNFSSYKIKIKH